MTTGEWGLIISAIVSLILLGCYLCLIFYQFAFADILDYLLRVAGFTRPPSLTLLTSLSPADRKKLHQHHIHNVVQLAYATSNELQTIFKENIQRELSQRWIDAARLAYYFPDLRQLRSLQSIGIDGLTALRRYQIMAKAYQEQIEKQHEIKSDDKLPTPQTLKEWDWHVIEDDSEDPAINAEQFRTFILCTDLAWCNESSSEQTKKSGLDSSQTLTRTVIASAENEAVAIQAHA